MRRVFVDHLTPGPLELEPREAHHLRDVLRARVGEAIELFDPQGHTARATVRVLDRDRVELSVGEPQTIDLPAGPAIVVASAVPKNERADWLVEKLGEVGVARWVPLRTARSVVHPAGPSKFERWRRIAVESAKQSRRAGVMEIGELTPIESLAFAGEAVLLSTRGDCVPLAGLPLVATRTLLIGPEGGWTEAEVDGLRGRGAIEASLTATVLRVETAAVVAAGICASSRPA